MSLFGHVTARFLLNKRYIKPNLCLEGTEILKNVRIFISIIVLQLVTYSSAQTYQFTNCGASGRVGPSQEQCNAQYGTGVVTVNGGKQQWTVPSSGNYSIEIFGASGGNYGQNSYTGGKGAKMKGDFILNAGSILEIVVGQQGSPNNSNPQTISAGGGGGSFVYALNNSSALIVAGGGGGPSYKEDGYDAGINNNGTTNGGSSASGGGGGGGGLVGNGGESGQGAGGESFDNGSVGGCGFYYSSCNENQGGFGGGGGGSWANGNDGGGGGGGYNGGNGGPGGSQDTGGFGGGSYNSGANQDNSSGVKVGHGSVTITFLGPDLPDPITSIDITGTSGYRMLSSPVSGAVYGDLLDELWTQGMTGSDDPDNGGANAWTWNNNWNALTDLATDNYTAGSGVLVYVFADTDFDGTDNLPVTLTLNGTQNTSPVTIATNDDSWNLLGNPYGYALSIQQLAIDNAGYGAVYIWDNTTNAYKIHNGTTGDIADGLIAPFQGFWSRADAGAASYTFTESSISSDAGTNYRTTTDESNGSAVFTFTNGEYSSSTYLSFTPEGQINLDPADANRLVPLSPAEHLTSMIYESNKSLSINNLPYDLSTDISFPMDVMMLSPTDDGYETQAEQVDLTWDITNLPEGITLVLRNNITGQNINLTGYPSASINLSDKGSFSTSGDFMAIYPAVGQSQFTLSVYGTLVAAEDDDILPERLTVHSAYPNPFNPSTIISFDLPDADMVSLDIFDIAGRQVASLISEYMIPGSHQINWNPGNLSSGIYLVNLVIGTETFNQKITFIK